MNKGKFYIVSTPIGNLKDITYRAVEVLKECDYVLSEDTRETQKIFTQYDIKKPQISYREQNHERVVGHILNLLAAGNTLALVSDSGTPLVSDPGFKLVQAILREDFSVETVPGPSAVLAALTVSGLPTDRFCFLGFLPRTDSVRASIIKQYGSTDSTLIFFESPYRISKLLEELVTHLGNRQVCIVAELTKVHEKVIRGRINDVISGRKLTQGKGQFVVMVAKEDF